MERKQSKKRRLFRLAKTSNSTSGLASSPGPSEAHAGNFAAVSETSGMAAPSMLAGMRRFFHRTNQGPSTTIATEIVDTTLGVRDQEEQEQFQAVAGQGTATTRTGARAQEQAQSDSINDAGVLIARSEPEPSTTLFEIENFSDTYLKPFKDFNQVVSTSANVHPYTQNALATLASVAQLLINKANPDRAVYSLLDTVRSVYGFLTEDESIKNIDEMRDTLAKIARVMSDSARFIINYSATKNFWKGAGKNISSETWTVIDDCARALDGLMQQYHDHVVRNIQVNMYRIFEDINLEGMPYAYGAGLNVTKKCVEGTRTEILREIVNWIHDPDFNAPRILWLHGQAGRGKSAIAHTIASWAKDVGGVGSCFCFARDRQAERREEKILTTIARDLADRDPAFRRALADIVAQNRSLKTTPDVRQQWQRLILEPLSKVDGIIVGNVVVVIDALDESGPETSREHILSLLSSSEATYLPSNFRILLTSRPLPDIERVLSTAVHVKATSLDDISAASAERDIQLYVSAELRHFPEIGATEVMKIAQKADGLFEWARLACMFIKPNRPGRTIVERYNEVMFPHRGVGGTLLDVMYKTILQDTIPQDDITLGRFCSVMQQIMSTVVPLQLDALNAMRSHFPPEEDHFNIIILLEFMAPLLSGIADRCSVVRPLHASFYDFLTDRTRSGLYFVGRSSMHRLLAFASLEALWYDLKFNICGLESSYSSNSEVIDLEERVNRNFSHDLSYSCQYWAHHLQRTEFDSMLGTLVKAIVGCEKLIFWLESLSLLGGLAHVTSALNSTIEWLQGQTDFDITLALAQDGIKFLQNFAGVISHSTPHLYLSALPFTPSDTVLARMLIQRFSCLPRISVGGLKEWPVAQCALQGHTDRVNSARFSPDGKMIVSGSLDKTVMVWDAESGEQIGGPLEGHIAGVWSVGFSPDGKRIVSGSLDKTLRVWDAEQGVQIGGALEGHTGGVWSVGFSPDQRRIVSGSFDKTVRVWDAEWGVQIGGALEGHTGGVLSVEFSPDGKRIVSGSDDKTVRVWDAERGVQIGGPLERHTGGVWSVGFSPDGKKIVSGSSDRMVRVWDAESGVQIGAHLEGHTDWVRSVGFSPDAKRIVSGSDDMTVRVWDAERGVQIGSPLVGHRDWVWSVGFSPDAKRIVSGSDDKTVRVWDAERCVQLGGSPEGHTGEVWSIAFSPDGKRIVSGSDDNTVRVWDAERGVQIGGPLEGHTGGVYSVGFSSDGKRIVSGSSDTTVRIWDTVRGVQIGGPLQGHTAGVRSVGFSFDGKRIVSGSSDKTVRIWDAVQGVQIGEPLEGHTDWVWSVGISSDGTRVVSGSDDKTVRVWDAERGVQIGGPLTGHADWVRSVGFSFDGKRIVSGSSDKTARVWDVEKGVQIGGPLEGHTDGVYSAGFSSDGKRIVSGSSDNTVRVWDAERGCQISGPLQGHTEWVQSVGFSFDGKRIVSGSSDKTVRVWDAEHSPWHSIAMQSPAFSSDSGCIPFRSGSRIAWDANTSEDGQTKCAAHTLEGLSYEKISSYIICFSSVSSHALCDAQQLLDGLEEDVDVIHQPVKLFNDGWIRGPKGRLLLWIPPSLQWPFYSMWNTMVIPRGSCIELDLSQMVHGQKWHQCFEPGV